MPLTPQSIERLRRARGITIRERDGFASIACRGTAVPRGNLVRRLAALLFDDSFEIPIQTSPDAFLGGPRRRQIGHDELVLDLDEAQRNPAWAALTDSLTPGGSIAVEWSRDGMTRRRRGDAVRLTTVAPFGTQETFTLAPTSRRSARRSRRRMRPIRAAAALVGLGLLAASASAATTVAITGILLLGLVCVRLAGSRRRRSTFRLGRFSFLAGLWSMLPSIAVVVTGLLVVVWLWRRRRSIQRIARFIRGDRGSGDGGADRGGFRPTHSARLAALGRLSGDAKHRATQDHLEKHVANVALMFDELAANWHLRVDLTRLDHDDPADHLLTAAFLDDADIALDDIVRRLREEGRADFVRCVHAALRNASCEHLPETRDDSHGMALVERWRHEVQRRLHATVPG